MPFLPASHRRNADPPVLELRPAPSYLRKELPTHQRRADGQNCVKLSSDDVKKIPGWKKLEGIANDRWGNHKRNIVTNDQHPDTVSKGATLCIASESIKIRFTGQPTCQSNKVSAGGGLKGTNGTLSLAVAQGFTASSQYTISQAATIGVSQTFLGTLDFPEVAGVSEAITMSASITNTLTKSFTAQYSELNTVTLLMTSPDGKSCDAGTNVTHCTLQGEGEMHLLATGYVWFEYEDKQKEKGKGEKHFKWNLELDKELTVAERTSIAKFKGSVVASTHATYKGACT
ncbi:hypothetical protein GYMLUDRAFT_73603 [Collybiopsis luxurians FD-317 M1]|uniref:Uncharacterized protein n=1 Tax=Collybiopsis luxurians FD-317 M1 TaxID=944289 RepID=A0A0D0BZE0_9AGAR|nr:hypothetical protein GYMLUDRAFT_73603 [Collybiopsis luxurians FD-317 M1]